MPSKIHTVFCDDIRREDNGKMILIGVYMDDLVPSSIPLTFPLSLWVTFKSEEADAGKLSIILTLPGGKHVKMHADMEEMPAGSNVSFIFGGVPVEIREPGMITVQLQFADDEPIDAGSLIVTPPPSQMP